MMDVIDEAACRKLVALLKVVEFRAQENERFFTGRNKADVVDKTFRECFNSIENQISNGIVPLICYLFKIAARYDADIGIRANGIRSWLTTVHRVALELNAMCAFVESSRKSVFFRRVKTAQQLKSLADYLAATRQCLDVLKTYTEISPDSVICDTALDSKIQMNRLIDVISDMRLIDVASLRGKAPCFHYDESVRPLGHGLLFTFAAYCQSYKHKFWPSKETDTVFSPSRNNSTSEDDNSSSLDSREDLSFSNGSDNGSESSNSRPFQRRLFSFLTSNDALADDVRWGLANLDLLTLQNFWNYGDSPVLMAGVDFILPSVALSCAMNLHSVPLTVPTVDGFTIITLDPPESGSGLKPIKCRLISSILRQGQDYWLHYDSMSPSRLKPLSDAIIFQVHGGGFICQSSRSGEVFLRQFSIETEVPFFCVDYSLLPDDPFPRAVDEVVFAFCWMLENLAKLGSTGKKVIAFGDSAGCCLLMSMCIRLQQMNIRLPDAIQFAYPYACSSFAPSPSRLLSYADPIMPIPLILRCCFGYASLDEMDAHTILGIADSRISSSAPESLCCSPFSAVDTSDLSPNKQPLRYCKTAPGQLFEELRKTRSSTSSGISSENSNQGAVLDFCMRPFSPSERLDVGDLLKMPLFSDPIFTPLMAPDDMLARMPYVHIVAASADPLLDDSVALCRKMRRAGGKCDLIVVEGLPHGFLNLSIVSGSCRNGSDKVIQNLKQLVRSQNTVTL